MSLPMDLVLVRHGESEGNIAHNCSRMGDDRHFTKEFRARHSSTWRLSDRGIRQAHAAGEWLQQNIARTFDRYLTSDYLRARETAAHLGLPDARWYTDFYLREREWGQLDALPHEERARLHADSMERRKNDTFYWCPPGGESMAALCNRLKWVLHTLHREMAGKRVIIMCHGEVMWGFRVLIERIDSARYLELDRSTDPRLRILNGQVLHYTRQDPGTGEIHPYVSHMRQVCPWKPDHTPGTWEPITRPRYTNEELLRTVERVPRTIVDQD